MFQDFKDAADIRFIEIPTKKSLGIAKISFSSEAIANSFIERFNGTTSIPLRISRWRNPKHKGQAAESSRQVSRRSLRHPRLDTSSDPSLFDGDDLWESYDDLTDPWDDQQDDE